MEIYALTFSESSYSVYILNLYYIWITRMADDWNRFGKYVMSANKINTLSSESICQPKPPQNGYQRRGGGDNIPERVFPRGQFWWGGKASLGYSRSVRCAGHIVCSIPVTSHIQKDPDLRKWKGIRNIKFTNHYWFCQVFIINPKQ